VNPASELCEFRRIRVHGALPLPLAGEGGEGPLTREVHRTRRVAPPTRTLRQFTNAAPSIPSPRPSPAGGEGVRAVPE
jgi:hypothetical protein